MATKGEVTELLHSMRDGDSGAFDQLLPLVYDELRKVARYHLRRSRRGQTLDTVGLVNEVYLKMAGQRNLDVKDRGHFLAVSARAMRQVITSSARARMAAKRGAGAIAVTLNEGEVGVAQEAERLFDVNRALERLASRHERLAQVFECRFFAGLSEEETAEAVGVSLRTVQRDWMRARAWIQKELAGEADTKA